MRSKTVIGEQIYNCRRALGWTQGKLASKVGVSRAAISQFELGDTSPSVETQNKLSHALDQPLATFWHEPSPSPYEEFGSIKFISASSYDDLTYLAQKRDVEPGPYTDPYNIFPRISIIQTPDMDVDYGFIIEVKNDSMGPRYPRGARYYMSHANLNRDEEIRFMSGVYLFVLDGREPFMRRMISTAAGVFTLQADANGEKMEFEIQDLKQRDSIGTCLIFKLGSGVFMPAE